MTRKDWFLLLSVLILGGLALGSQGAGVVPLAVLAVVVVGFSVLSRRIKRSKERKACGRLALFVLRKQLPPEEEKKLDAKLAKKNVSVAALLNDLRILRDSIELALTSRKRENAEGKLHDARQAFERIQKVQARLIGPEVFAEISSAVARLEEEFPTKLCLNLARDHMDRAEKVKTEKGRAKYVKLARETLTQGINSGNCRVPELRAALKELNSR